MPINEHDQLIFSLSEKINDDSVIPEIISNLRDKAIKEITKYHVDSKECYPEVSYVKDCLVFNIYIRE